MTTLPTQLQRYERWGGRSDRGRWAWLAIVRSGLRLANKDAQARFLLYASLSFVAGICGLFYALHLLEEFMEQPPSAGIADLLQSTMNFVRFALGIDLSGVRRIGELRGVIWRAVFMMAVNVQLFWIALTVSRVGPGLIASDLKARALPIYFARPITPTTYLLGKWCVLAFYVGLLTLVPNLAALLFATLLTGGLNTAGETLTLAAQLVLAGVGVMVFAGLVMLALSSLSSDKRYVSVAWFAVCVLPVIAQASLNDNLPAERTRGWLGSISLHGNVRVLTEWLFGMRRALAESGLPTEGFSRALLRPVEPVYPAVVLGGLTVLAALVGYRRVVRFSRAAASV